MVKWQDFTLDLVQTVIFTPEPNAFASGKAVTAILAHFQDRFTGEMQVLPLPAEFPHEIPRVQLQSSDNRWQLSMGPVRTDAVWRNRPPASAESLAEIATMCAQMPQRYVEALGIPVARLAIIIQRFCPVPDPAETLIERFCDESSRREPFNRSATFEIHNHKVYAPKHGNVDYSINSWVRCKSGVLREDKQPVVLIEQDLNTLVEDADGHRFDVTSMQEFFEMAASEADQIGRKYFPD
jgi:hypothetical protein